MRRFTLALRSTARTLFLFAAMGALAGAAGCAQEQADGSELSLSTHAHALASLIDCAEASVSAEYAASPADVDGYYVVSDGARVVCATDFDGLQLLAQRFDHGTTASADIASSEPMPGRGTNPGSSDVASSEPMPGRGTSPGTREAADVDVGSSEPMPGRGTSPTGDPRGSEIGADPGSPSSGGAAAGSGRRGSGPTRPLLRETANERVARAAR